MRIGALQAAPYVAPSPFRAMAITAVVVFATELCITLLFALLPPLPELLAAVRDATALILSTSPVLYVVWFVPLRRQIEQLARTNLALAGRAHEDPLTQLPNRAAFIECVRRELQHAARVHGPLTVVVVDVRRFGEVNGALGHERGDVLLKHLAERLRSHAATLGPVARLGSDVFGIVLAGVDLARAGDAAERLHDLIEVPFVLGEAQIQVEGQIGFAAFPNHGDGAQTLLQRAELALQNAKKAGDRSGAYAVENEPQAQRRFQMLGKLRAAIDGGELSLVYQPKISLSAGQFAGVEALVRWTHPELGPISPAEFVPLAEQTNLIRPLTLWVLEEAVRQIAAWKSHGLEVPVAVNLSARNLTDASIPERIAELLKVWNVEPKLLTAEVTESAVLADPERAGIVLQRLRELGVALSIDDFGTGYGSLTYVATMPAAELKIDRSFVRELSSNEGSSAVVRAVIGLAHNLDLEVVCEGVEDEQTLLRLRELGCDFAQGYFVSRPLEARDLPNFVAQRTTHVFALPLRTADRRPQILSLVPRLSPPPSLSQSLRAIRIASGSPP